jgi:hypothetical protein
MLEWSGGPAPDRNYLPAPNTFGQDMADEKRRPPSLFNKEVRCCSDKDAD